MSKRLVLLIVIILSWLMYQYPHSMLNAGELVGGHQELKNKCFSCHEPFFGISSSKCVACHKTEDIGKDSMSTHKQDSGQAGILFHHMLENQNCTDCHTDHKGIIPDHPISSFEHTLLSQTIINKCSQCHSKPTDTLHTFLSPDCINCHNTKDWTTSEKFDHNMVLSSERDLCSNCHKSPNDKFHQMSKDNCSKCHSTTKWLPSTFDHSAYFELDKDHNVNCATCHANNNYSSYTCYGCHEHSQNKIAQEHREEGITDFTNCVSCHKNANEDDIRMNGNNKTDRKTGQEIKNNNETKDRKKSKKQEHNDEENEH
ncbi:MAG: class III cytochrome C family protein [Bacteroidia bacterium]|nr:class III cytochrome C family protein [Bacteroidia bacterium]